MTLDSRVYVHGKINAHDVFRKCQQMLDAENAETKDEQDTTYIDGQLVVRPENPWTLMNKPGQDFNAWLRLNYKPGAPLRTEADAASHDEDCNVPGSEYYDPEEAVCEGDHQPACWVEVSFDSSYGYRDDQGRGCGDLHAGLISELGQWLDAQGVAWSWKNEYTGEVHHGYSSLVELASDGCASQAWFQTTVAPAIAAEIGRAGR
jgi:hypothetical protein